MTPEISVIIPTHNRLPCLRLCLAALEAQTFPLDRMEVIVVADGCTDGTESALGDEAFPFAFRVVAQAPAGPGAARNRGASVARAPILLFIDDDVIPSPPAVEAHARVHTEQDDCVGVGPYLLDESAASGYFGQMLYGFWQRTFDRMGAADHQPTSRDFLTGNLSVRASKFASVGGFNETFGLHGMEDYEFGIRMLETETRCVYLPEARSRHLETTNLSRHWHKALNGGRSWVKLVGLHPHLLTTMGLDRPGPIPRLFAFAFPKLGAALAHTGASALPVFERLRLLREWHALVRRVRSYWFWRGVAEEVGSLEELYRRMAKIRMRIASEAQPESGMSAAGLAAHQS